MLRIQLLVHGRRGLGSNVWILSAPHTPELLFLPIVAWHASHLIDGNGARKGGTYAELHKSRGLAGRVMSAEGELVRSLGTALCITGKGLLGV